MDKKYRYGEECTCIICGRLFKPRDKGLQQKCCSNACRGRLQTNKAKSQCVTCGKEFLPARPEYKNCSRKCGTAYRVSHHVFDPMVEVRNKLALFCCSAISRCLRGKSDKTAKMLEYTVSDLRAHIEKHFEPDMSWKNYGKKIGQWSIDHTRPISKFPETATILEINALNNLRPMWHTQNCSKKNKWEGS